jgi:hypothetical protein
MRVVLITDGGPVHIDHRGGSLYDSIVESVQRCEAVGLRPMRLHSGDWLTMAAIAGRVGKSRETVRLWSIGRLGPGRFPPPLNPESETSFYSWAEVAPWLRRAGYPVPSEEPVLAAMNLALQLRHLAPRLTRLDSVLACVLRRPASRSAATRDEHAPALVADRGAGVA